VILEDSGALIGLAFAAVGLVLRQVTGNSMWDGIAALAIAALLIVIAFELARTNVGLLIGKQASPKLVEDIRASLDEQPDVLSVVDVRTMMIGTGKVLVCARIDYVDEITASEAEQASLRIHEVLGERFPDVEDVFVEPVPRDDRPLQRAAQSRS
jgi:divalent metal cation (Fe/Co/Zn/Cd) transporter